MRTTTAALTLVALLGLALPAPGQQADRRDREDPELVLDTGGRLAACDELRFTPDGKHLVAVGDDKVARIWETKEGKLDPSTTRVLRWDIWREQRGSIYAMALAPHEKGWKVVIGGLGALTTTVQVLDFQTGKPLHTVLLTSEQSKNPGSVRSLAFAPSGGRVAIGTADGSVWLWDMEKATWLGRHTPPTKETTNFVRLVHFRAEDQLLSISDSGELCEWTLGDTPGKARGDDLKLGGVFRAVPSPDGKWLALAVADRPLVALRRIDGAGKIDFPLEKGQFPNAVAFTPDGRQLIVAVGGVKSTPFYMEADDRLLVLDLTGEQPKVTQTIPHSYRVDALAVHPDGRLLAIAGGDNHEVKVWDLSQEKQVSLVQGEGACIWDVAISQKGDAIGFRTQRDPASTDVTARGKGPWRVFELEKRKWIGESAFTPVKALTTAAGWRVEPDPRDRYTWHVRHESGTSHAIRLHPDRESVPRCYLFLEAQGDRPVQLVIGHYYGVSVFDVTRTGVTRTRLCTGHQGEVMALGVSSDGSWLVSAGTDQTIVAWNLARAWPSQAILGASFQVVGPNLRVKSVDVGSPAWEAGLVEGDLVERLGFDAAWVEGGPAAWLARLQNPVPGKELYFQVRRGDRTVYTLSTARQRPLWRFFPSREGEWVIWMWRNPFYDASTRGDFYLGWHVNSLTSDRAPTFYRAEQLRKHYQKPGVIDALLRTLDPSAALELIGKDVRPARFDEHEPPLVEVALGQATPVGRQVKLIIRPRGGNPDWQPRQAELWVNDLRLQSWGSMAGWQQVDGTYVKELILPSDRLRSGKNALVLQTYNNLGWRSEEVAGLTHAAPPAGAPRLLGLTVGINDYRASAAKAGGRAGERALGNLVSAVKDAEQIRAALEKQTLFKESSLILRLDQQADREAILEALDELARKARPDDLCVIFLAGHGDFREKVTDTKGDAFFFCGPKYDPNSPHATGISNELLIDKLSAIAGRKVVLLDACHSGEAPSSMVRDLLPGGQGPTILAACDRSQRSFENPRFGHGLFTYAILEALTTKQKESDFNEDGFVDTEELFGYTEERIPELLREINYPSFLQTPVMFAPRGQPPYRIARAK